MRIALDAMGGDHAPKPIVIGAIAALAEFPDIEVILVGDQAQVEACIPADTSRDRLSIHHCTQVIGMHDSPVDGLRKKPDNSISRSWQLLAEGEVDAVVSAGNTGAMVAGGLRLRKFLPLVERPGIATLMPTAKGVALLLDVGANVHPKPLHLLQYGVMGSVFAKNILKIENPRIGLMNVGAEESKGNNLTKSTHQLFSNSPFQDQFVGNVEGRDIHRGVCDVIVTDGFVGNVVLKLCEGVFEFIMKMVAKEIVEPLQNDQLQASQALQNLVSRYDYRNFGGAPLLGIEGICIICHGSSDERAIKNALGVAAKYARECLNSKITAELARLSSVTELNTA